MHSSTHAEFPRTSQLQQSAPQHQSPDPSPNLPRRDYLLLAVSLLFTGASLASTLAGARVLLGDTRWALALGIGVQAVPILLATGLAGHNYSRSLRTFVGGLCVSLSIYASTAWFARCAPVR